jgi:hypothetical protein
MNALYAIFFLAVIAGAHEDGDGVIECLRSLFDDGEDEE